MSPGALPSTMIPMAHMVFVIDIGTPATVIRAFESYGAPSSYRFCRIDFLGLRLARHLRVLPLRALGHCEFGFRWAEILDCHVRQRAPVGVPSTMISMAHMVFVIDIGTPATVIRAFESYGVRLGHCEFGFRWAAIFLTATFASEHPSVRRIANSI